MASPGDPLESLMAQKKFTPQPIHLPRAVACSDDRSRLYVVVGTSGSGKSMFARALSAKVGAKYVELDNLHWGSNWTPRSHSHFESAVREATTGDRWVVDGNYSVVRDAFWPSATHVVWLNFSRPVVLFRVLRRTVKRTLTREELWAGNRESFSKAFLSKQSILLWSLTTYTKNKTKYAKLRASPEYAHLLWHELRSPWQARAFLRQHESDA